MNPDERKAGKAPAIARDRVIPCPPPPFAKSEENVSALSAPRVKWKKAREKRTIAGRREPRGLHSQDGLHIAQCATSRVSNARSHCLSSPWRVAAGHCNAMLNNMLAQRPAVRTSERALRLRLRVAARETRAEHRNRRRQLAVARMRLCLICRCVMQIAKEDAPLFEWNVCANLH